MRYKLAGFLAFILISVIECILYIVSVTGLANAQFVPQVVNELFAFAFFIAEGASIYLFVKYLKKIGSSESKQEKTNESNILETEKNVATMETNQRSKQVKLVLQKAVEERNVEVYFQPIYSLKEKKIVALEALARLRDEKLGLIFPDEFIPLAEENGSMIQIGEIVLENCCRFLVKHILPNDSLGIRTIHVNVSEAECMQQNMNGVIAQVLEKYHIPPNLITLEVGGHKAILNSQKILSHMESLCKGGITFAADGYGAKEYNLAALVKLPFREIKIDKERTRAYFENETTRIIMKSEIQAMQRLEIDVVVEGIETKEQSDAMEALGVNYIQGYYYGKPMPEKECLVYIRKFDDGR